MPRVNRHWRAGGREMGGGQDGHVSRTLRQECRVFRMRLQRAEAQLAAQQCDPYRAVGEQLSLLKVSRVERVASVLHLLRAALLETPLAHDEGVVHGEAVDLIDAARLDRLIVLLVAGQVGRGAGGRERAGQGKDDDALALHELLGGHILPREGVVTADGVVTDTALESNLPRVLLVGLCAQCAARRSADHAWHGFPRHDEPSCARPSGSRGAAPRQQSCAPS